MKDCVFCKIIAGDLPCYKVYEDELFLGFLDIHPRTVGHTLLIPKKHFRWVYDIPEFGLYWQAALSLTHTLQKTLNPFFVTYVTHGLDIPHAHIHIMPRAEKEIAYITPLSDPSPAQLEQVARKIRRTGK